MALVIFYQKSTIYTTSPVEYSNSIGWYDYDTRVLTPVEPWFTSPADVSFKVSKDLLLDCYQNGSSVRFVYAKGDGVDSPTYYIADEPNKILLKVELVGPINSGLEDMSRKIYLYNKSTRSVESRIIECKTTYFLPGLYEYEATVYFLRSVGVIDSYCVGTTRREVYFAGAGIPDPGQTVKYSGGVSTANLDYQNSAECGFTPPEYGAILTKPITIKIDRRCYKNKVYLKWKNLLGGYDQWLFHHTQTDQLKSSELGVFDIPVTYLEDASTNRRSKGKEGEVSLLVGADNLTDNEFQNIRTITLSPEVIIVDKDNNKIEVTIEPGTFSYETKDSRHSISFQINYPRLYTQSN
jgi:hypothetical protein